MFNAHEFASRLSTRQADLHLPDPPVYLNNSGMHDEPQKPIRENETLSEFVLQMAVCETIITREPLIVSSRSDKDVTAKVEKIQREYINLGFPTGTGRTILCGFMERTICLR